MNTETLLIGLSVFFLAGGIFSLYMAYEPKTSEEIIGEIVEPEEGKVANDE